MRAFVGRLVPLAVIVSASAPSGTCFGQIYAAPDSAREPVTSRAAPPPESAPALPAVGLGADAGLPDGLMGSLVLRPLDVLRVQLGAGSNSASPGLRAGVTVLPLTTGPSFTVEAGHYLSGDASGIVKTFFGGIGRFANYVGKIDYTFVNLHGGLDFGAELFTVFLHGGVTYMRATFADVSVPIEMPPRTMPNGPTTTVRFREDPVLRMWAPSVKLGLIFYLQ